MTDIQFMKRAVARAKAAAKAGEVPIGAVLVKDGKIISTGRNMRETRRNALLHAEIVAIDRGCKALGAWRLEGCTLYVTLEPCPMCAGAIINARIPTVVYGAREEKSGSCGSVIDLFSENYGFRPTVYGGVLREECAGELRAFFEKLR